MRRGNSHAAPSSCEGYPIRSFLLTDSVAYAPWLIFPLRFAGTIDGGFQGVERAPRCDHDRPQVIHRARFRFCTALVRAISFARSWEMGQKNGGSRHAAPAGGTRGNCLCLENAREPRQENRQGSDRGAVIWLVGVTGALTMSKASGFVLLVAGMAAAAYVLPLGSDMSEADCCRASPMLPSFRRRNASARGRAAATPARQRARRGSGWSAHRCRPSRRRSSSPSHSVRASRRPGTPEGRADPEGSRRHRPRAAEGVEARRLLRRRAQRCLDAVDRARP